MTKPHRVLFALCFIALANGRTPIDAAFQPNVLVIITDEHNFRTLGCYREQLPREQAEMWGPGVIVETPHIDRIAHEGAICTRAYATAPVCTPCRAAMITGLYPQNTGAPKNDMKLRGDVPTLAKILGSSGYRTSFVGKWHLGGPGKPEWEPKVDGGFMDKSAMYNRGHWKKFTMTDDGPRVGATDKKGRPSYNVAGADKSTFSTDFLTDRAIEYMGHDDERPFLMVISYPDPHGPNTVRSPYDRMFDHLRFLPPRTYGRDDVAKPGWLSGNAKKHPPFRGEQMSKYFGMVKCLDDNIGRILQHLSEHDALDSTIIVLTSDHGDLCYEHDRLNKGNPYEGSARVPLLIRFPSAIPPGTVYREAVGTVDATPSLVALAGVEHDAKFQGRDLSSRLKSPGADVDATTFLRNAGTEANWLAAVDGRYKLIVSTKDQPWLMDLEADPDELLNFFGRPGTDGPTKRLAASLQEYAESTNDPFFLDQNIRLSVQRCLK